MSLVEKSFHLILLLSTGSGEITKPALAAFYRSVIGLSANRVEEIIDTAYDRMTSVSRSFLIIASNEWSQEKIVLDKNKHFCK